MLRIVLGFKGHKAESEVVCLYAGHDGEAAQTAVDTAPSGIERFEAVHHPVTRRMKRAEGALEKVRAGEEEARKAASSKNSSK